ncbi:MAG: glycine cleavage system aminomethyltransferase GcvT [Gemmatimonadota bacterium]
MQTADQGLRATPLDAEHARLGAKMVPFAGYSMPVHYSTGIVAEHNAVRTAAGLFDVSHMGELYVSGPGALALIQYVSTNDASALDVGQAQYTALCREDGGVLDDCLVYRLSDAYLIVVNASNLDKDREWIRGHAAAFEVAIDDRSERTALLALQGPRAAEILASITTVDLDAVGYYRFAEGAVGGRPALVARTGYTGEDGFELYVANEDAAAVWRALLEKGSAAGLLPAGLGARDSLRLEVGYALYGNDLDEEHTAIESGLGWVVKPDKGDFVGRDALVREKAEGAVRRLVGFRLSERGIPRPGYPLQVGEEVVGRVTSGVHSPSLGCGVGLGYVAREHAAKGALIDVIIRGKPVPAEIERPPFYKDGSIRR